MPDNLSYADVTLICDYTLGIVVKLLLGGLDVDLNMSHDLGINAESGEDFVIAFEDLDSVPSLLLFGHVVQRGLLDVGERMLNRA